MNPVLVLVAMLAAPPVGMFCEVTAADTAAITLVCANPKTGGWFVAVLNRATGTVWRATGRRS